MSTSHNPQQHDQPEGQWNQQSNELVPTEQNYGQVQYEQTQQYDQAQQFGQPQQFGQDQQFGQGQYGQPQQSYGQDQYSQQVPGQPHGPQGYAQPMGLAVSAPYGIEPMTGLPYSDKSKTTAGVLGILLGGLGAGRFYKGDIGLGIAQLVVSVVTLGFGSLWGFIDGIVMLTGRPLDREGRPLR